VFSGVIGHWDNGFTSTFLLPGSTTEFKLGRVNGVRRMFHVFIRDVEIKKMFSLIMIRNYSINTTRIPLVPFANFANQNFIRTAIIIFSEDQRHYLNSLTLSHHDEKLDSDFHFWSPTPTGIFCKSFPEKKSNFWTKGACLILESVSLLKIPC